MSLTYHQPTIHHRVFTATQPMLSLRLSLQVWILVTESLSPYGGCYPKGDKETQLMTAAPPD
ncbi:MAG: hypothetical protein HC772_02920 [Leptolyngbyaceae cyanobacterium CRU_2_3]|nr:hypothetical protein [Leptolyngbyaceae cyanobacterium CRU_2_3]